MSQRRAPGPCPHGSGGTRPYPVWPVDGWELGTNSHLDAALAELEEALTACAPLLPELAKNLTSQDVQRALKAVPLERRPAVLLPLGLNLRPRQVSQGLCQDVRGRLARADDHALHHALDTLGYAISADIRLRVAGEELGSGVAGELPDPVQRWGTRLLLTSIWGGGLSSVKDARVWHWAAQQPWFAPLGVTAAQVDAICGAAERVIAASPTFGDRNSIAGSAEIEAALPGPKSASEAGDQPAPRHDTTTTGVALAATAVTDAKPQAEEAAIGTGTVLLEAIEDFEASLTEALPAAERVAGRLREHRPPELADLALVSRPRASFDTAAAAATAAGHPALDDTVAALRAALEQASASKVDAEARALLDVVLTLGAASGSPLLSALDVAQRQARELLAVFTWDDPSREQARVLGALVALTLTTLEPASRLELITQFTQTRPELALLAVQAGQLTVTTAVPATPSPTTAAITSTPTPDATTVPTEPGTTAPELDPAAASAPAPSTLTTASEAANAATPAAADPQRLETQNSDQSQVTGQPRQHNQQNPAQPVPPDVPDESAASAGDPDQQEPAGSHEAGLAALIAGTRFGLAAAVAAADQRPASQRAVLRIAALAQAVRHQNGPVAAALRTEFDALTPDLVAEDITSVLLTVPALVRAAVITGEPTVGVLLTELAGRVEPNLSSIANEVGQLTLKGVLLDAQAVNVLANVTEAEHDKNAIIAAARHVRTRPRTLRFKRATDISKILLNTTGVLGKPLLAVERNDVNEVAMVTAELARLNDSSYARSTIDKLDHQLQGSSARPLEGASKQDLLALFTEALRPLADWVDNVRALNAHTDRTQHWSAGEVEALRTRVLERRNGALEALAATQVNAEPATASAASAAHAILTDAFAILDGTAMLPTSEPTPQEVLTLELLRVPGAAVDVDRGEVTPPAGTTVAELLAASRRTWDEALRAQIAAERFDAAHHMLKLAQQDQLPARVNGDGPLSLSGAKVTEAETTVRAELSSDLGQLAATLRRARLNNEISDEQDGELAGVLADAAAGLKTHTLASVRSMLGRAEALLPKFRAEAKSRLTVRLDVLRADQRIDEEKLERVAKLIDDGQLSTAEELIYFLEIDEDVPDVYQSEDLQRFFPAVPDALPQGITAREVETVKDRGQMPDCPVLDFSELSHDAASLAADALNAWRQLGGYEPENRSKINETDMIAPALRLIGIEARRHQRLDKLPRARDRRFVEFRFEEILGKALVPSFGSKLGNRLRVLLAWGQPGADLLISWADGDPSGESLLIAHFGTMSAQTRRDLAAKAARRAAPIVVLDDAALIYLAAHGNRQMTATMNVLLPFSAVNPYLRQKRGVVAPEMFYGRDAERRSVLDPDGTQLVFGGRGLGKSALLNSAAEQFEKQASVGERVAVYLDLKAVGIRRESAIDQEAIWDALLAELNRRELCTTSYRAGRQGSAREQVHSGLQSWLDGDQRRRLLVLLDEADQFFEADMPHFMETTRLKSLGQAHDNRVKVVFAGLHSVQRYAKTSRNAPFGHMAQRPTVIGPLRPQHAADLLARPMAALGFDFEDPDLVNRVLGFCSYQPFLLQIFANRLIELMHSTRNSDGVSDTQPPYVITRDHVEAVETHADLRADIRTAFHETLNLDHRYGVIAHVLAQHAHEAGLDARMTDARLREECLSYWPDGFVKLDVEGFRAYLQEMTGLGVLAPNNDGRGWHLRSANVLQMIGTRDDVEAQLVSAAELSVPDEFLALESRLKLSEGRLSPLTASQLDDVLGDHGNQVRLIVGSFATGIGHVTAAVREAADVGHRFVVPQVSTRRQFEEELATGQPGQRRVVVDDLHTKAPSDDACADAVRMARTRIPRAAGVTRSAVVVAGPAQLSLWRDIFAELGDETVAGAGAMLPVSTVTLRRYDAASLRVWSLERQAFTSEERREQMLAVTGGWPHVVEEAAARVKADGGLDEPAVLAQLRAELASPAGAAALVDATGLCADTALATAFEGVLSVIDSGPLSRSDLQVAVDMTSADPVAVECLLALQLFDVDASGRFVVEPCLLRAWPHRT